MDARRERTIRGELSVVGGPPPPVPVAQVGGANEVLDVHVRNRLLIGHGEQIGVRRNMCSLVAPVARWLTGRIGVVIRPHRLPPLRTAKDPTTRRVARRASTSLCSYFPCFLVSIEWPFPPPTSLMAVSSYVPRTRNGRRNDQRGCAGGNDGEPCSCASSCGARGSSGRVVPATAAPLFGRLPQKSPFSRPYQNVRDLRIGNRARADLDDRASAAEMRCGAGPVCLEGSSATSDDDDAC